MHALPHLKDARYGHCIAYQHYKTVSSKSKNSKSHEFIYIIGGKNEKVFYL